MKSIVEYLDAVKTGISEELDAKGLSVIVNHFDENEDFTKLVTPCVLLAVDELPETRQDDPAGQNQEYVNWSLYCVLSDNLEQADLQVVNFASLVKRIVKGNRFGLGSAVHNPEELRASPSNFARKERSFICWVVNFGQKIKVDEPTENEELFPLSDVFFGVNPQDDSDYKRIGEVSE